MAVTSLPPASRALRDNELRAVVNALDTNRDAVLQKNELNITSAALRKAIDTNRNGKFESEEVKLALLADTFTVSLTRDAAIQVLLKFDSNQDGTLSQKELELNEKAVNLIDNYGAKKYGAVNGLMTADDKGRLRRTGHPGLDGRITITEMANAIADGRLQIGRSFYTPGSLN